MCVRASARTRGRGICEPCTWGFCACCLRVAARALWARACLHTPAACVCLGAPVCKPGARVCTCVVQVGAHTRPVGTQPRVAACASAWWHVVRGLCVPAGVERFSVWVSPCTELFVHTHTREFVCAGTRGCGHLSSTRSCFVRTHTACTGTGKRACATLRSVCECVCGGGGRGHAGLWALLPLPCAPPVSPACSPNPARRPRAPTCLAGCSPEPGAPAARTTRSRTP